MGIAPIGLLAWFAGLTAILVIPLGFSLTTLILEERLKAEMKTILQRETITVGQQTQLISINLDRPFFPWSQTPSTVTLVVANSSGQPLTSQQVDELRLFLEQRLNQPLRLVMRVMDDREFVADLS